MGVRDESQDFEDEAYGRPSKSARKREASSLQDLGVELAALPEAEIAALDLPDPLSAALRELKRLTSHGAQVRQRQYIGKLMRKIDAEPLREKMAERKRLHDVEIRRFQQIERWRDRLLSEPSDALAALLEERPQADRAKLAKLMKKAEQERSESRPPAAARELFAYLRQLMG
jgi:ribosome-associated protein